jgi:hypothetical protein
VKLENMQRGLAVAVANVTTGCNSGEEKGDIAFGEVMT